MDRFSTGEGLNLDNSCSQFSIKSPLDSPRGAMGSPLPPISDRTRSEISMVLYWEEMESIFSQLKDIEQELLAMYEFCMSLRLNAYEVFEVLEDLHIRFSELEDRLAAIRILTETGEYRPRDDDKVLTRNPLVLAKLWRQLDSKLRAPLTPELAARISDLES